MSGQDFSDPHGPATVTTAGHKPSLTVTSAAQHRLDHAVEWIAEHGVADQVLSITTIGRPSIHLDNIALLRQCLAGTGAMLRITENGMRAAATFNGIDFVAIAGPAAGVNEEVTL